MDRYKSNKKLLLLSAKYADIVYVNEARRRGYQVFSVGNRPDQPVHKLVDKYINTSYMDYGAIIQIVKENSIDVLCSGVTDACAIAAAYVCENLGMRGHDTFENAIIIHQKDQFKKTARDIGIKTPDAKWFESVEHAYDAKDELDYPVIVKPADLGGGQGITVVKEKNDYRKAIEQAFSKSIIKHIVVEKYIEGSLHSMTTFIVDGSVYAYGSANDYSFINKYLTNTGIFPADMHELTDSKLVEEAEAIARRLKLVDGLLHFQYIVDKHNEPWIIEMMRRSPGNNYLKALTRATGIDWVSWILCAEAGLDCGNIPKVNVLPGVQGYHSIMANCNGVFDEIFIDKAFKNHICELEYYTQKGKVINDYLTEKFGNIQFSYTDDKEAFREISMINEMAYARVL